MSGANGAVVAMAVLAFAYLAVISIRLCAIDIAQHRLPNRLVLPTYVVGLGLFFTASAVSGDWGSFLRALAGGAVLFGGYLVVRLASPASLGGGDVKLAGVLGLYLAWLGWTPLLLGSIAAFLIGGIHAVILLLTRRADRRTRIPFGPAMLSGAWVVIAGAVLSNLVSTDAPISI